MKEARSQESESSRLFFLCFMSSMVACIPDKPHHGKKSGGKVVFAGLFVNEGSEVIPVWTGKVIAVIIKPFSRRFNGVPDFRYAGPGNMEGENFRFCCGSIKWCPFGL